MVLAGLGIAGVAFGLSVLGLNFLPWWIVVALIVRRRAASSSPISCMRGARRYPALDLTLFRLPTFRASVVGGFVFRLGIGALPFLLPLMLQIGFGMTPFQSGLITFATAVGAMSMKMGDGDDPAPLRLPQHPAGQRADQRGLPRRLRLLHRGNAGVADGGAAVRRRLLPLAAVHQHQHARLCRRRTGARSAAPPRWSASRSSWRSRPASRSARLAVDITVRITRRAELARRRLPAGLPGGRADFGAFGVDFRAFGARCGCGNGQPHARRPTES